MGYSQAQKAQSRGRVLDKAAEQVRSEGLESLSIPALMKSVGLTHGGFYGHFKSRSELQTLAVTHALEEIAARPRPASFRDWVMGYLSLEHRAKRETGCAVAALLSDVGRADESTRAAMEEDLEASFKRLAPALNNDEASAMVAVSTMVGALALARVMTNDQRAEALLRAAREHVIALGPSRKADVPTG